MALQTETAVIMGIGGPEVYEGKDMLATHKGMNISGYVTASNKRTDVPLVNCLNSSSASNCCAR